MKRKLLLLFQPVCTCILGACMMENKNEWKDEVAGIYTTQYEQPYSTGFDTLFITKMESSSWQFQVLRHTAYQRKGDLESAETIHREENWVAVPDNTQPLLHIVPSGRELWFDAATRQLTTGATIYHLLK